MTTSPFFSVCIPATGRSENIFNTLRSVAAQTFRDFEVVVVTRGGDERTDEEIARFFDSAVFEANPFEYTYESLDTPVNGTDDWNDPVERASGRYIAMLEGDDIFLSYHLGLAYEYLSEHPGVGLYGTGCDGHPAGSFRPETYARHVSSMGDGPPPSQSVFVRTDPDGNPYRFDTESFDYCPELDLWVRIADDGYRVYHDPERSVVRSGSVDKTYEFWVDKVRDKFRILSEQRERLTDTERATARRRIAHAAIRRSQHPYVSAATSRAIRQELISHVGRRDYLKYRFECSGWLVQQAVETLSEEGPVSLAKKVREYATLKRNELF